MLMVKPAIHLDISCQRRVESLPLRDNPFENGTFQTLGVVRSGTGYAFLDLLQTWVHSDKKHVTDILASSAIITRSPSDPPMSRSSSPGTI
jgi:hypothetical protein